MKRQTSLKPQDVVVLIKIILRKQPDFTFSNLAAELFMSASEVHSATKRCEMSRLLVKTEEGLIPNKNGALEFILHGLQYCFPAVTGGVVRGIPTGFAGPSLRKHYSEEVSLVPVWPDIDGQIQGITLYPLYPSVPLAAMHDEKFYDLLTIIDALRGGTARDRELAKKEIIGKLQ